MEDTQCPAIFAAPEDSLPAGRVAVACACISKPVGLSVPDNRGGLFVESNAVINRLPLFRAQVGHIARQAHPPQHCPGDRIDNPFEGVLLADNAPDLALTGLHDPVEVSGDDRKFRVFVCVREGGHRADAQHLRFQLMPARRAVFDDQPGDFRFHLFDKSEGGVHVAAQSLSQRLTAVAPGADGVVVVHLDIANVVPFEQADHLFTEVVLYPGVGHIPEPAVGGGQRLTATAEQMVSVVIGAGGLSDIVDFKPDTRYHPILTDRLDGVPESVGEQGGGYLVIAHRDVPRDSVFLEPAAVDDKVGKSLAFYRFEDSFDILLGRASPGCAVFVEHDRQLLFGCRPGIDCPNLPGGQPLGGFIDVTSSADRQNCFRRGQLFAWLQILAPVAKIGIGQPARNCQSVPGTVNLHLPGGIVGDLSAPEYSVFTVFDHQPREPFVDRHRPDLPEPFAADGGPAGLQLQVLNRVGLQPPFHTPDAPHPVNQHGIMCVAGNVGGQPAQRKAGQQLQRHRFIAAVYQTYPTAQRLFAGIP